MLIEYRNELLPCGVAEAVLLQIFPESFPQLFLPHQLLELVQHDRRLVVDDIAVDRARLIQIIQFLPYRVSPRAPLNVVKRIVM